VSEQAVLMATGVCVEFAGVRALNQVDFTAKAGTITGLVGPNGAGKSTLLNVLAGYVTPSRGEVYHQGRQVTSLRPDLRAREGIARTFQHPQLFDDLSVEDHLLLSMRLHLSPSRQWTDLLRLGLGRGPSAEESSSVEKLCHLLQLTDVRQHGVRGLPLGTRRLVELARALALEPSVLLLDEPSSGLDSVERTVIEETLRQIALADNIGIVLVEHDVDLVFRLATSVVVLNFGVVLAEGSPGAIRENDEVARAYLGVTSTKDKHVLAAGAARPLLNGSQAEPSSPNRQNEAAGLVIEELGVNYGTATALHSLSLCVRSGRRVAILGRNGAGKSTLARVLSGLVPASSGTIRLGDTDITNLRPEAISNLGLGHLPEGRGVFPNLSVEENLRMGVRVLSRRDRAARVSEAIETFPALANRRHQAAGSLSGGEQQMLAIGRLLIRRPKLVIADELSLGLAPQIVEAVLQGLESFAKAGATVLIIEQFVHHALAFADECHVLSNGRIVWSGRADEVGNDVINHYLGAE
jgi:branched-chain amino acid transport system ATP-binding protein